MSPAYSLLNIKSISETSYARSVLEMARPEIEMVIKAVYSAFEALDARRLDENFSHTETLTAFGTDED